MGAYKKLRYIVYLYKKCNVVEKSKNFNVQNYITDLSQLPRLTL